MKSVAIILSGREQFNAYYGGAVARWTHEVYRRMSDGIDAHVFGFPTEEENLYSSLEHHTSPVSPICKAMSSIPLARRYEDELWLRTLIRKIRSFDAVHIQNRPQWVAVLRRLGYHGRLLLHLHNDHLGHWVGPELDRLASQLDGLAVCSKYLMQRFASKSPSLAAKTRVVYNGVDTGLFYPRRELREAKTILFVGRFDPQKGVLQLTRAYAQVLENHPDAVLLIAGSTGFGTHRETEYVREVRDLAESLMRSKHAIIRFLGYVHHDRQLPELFQRATIFACPSVCQDALPLVSAEAMACGIPVVGANRGGIPEVLGEAGLVVDPEDTEALAAALSGLLTKSAYREQLGQAALRRCLQMFDWDVIAKDWASFLEEALLSKS